MTSHKVIVIGGGFSSLSAACYLAKNGYNVTLLEKNKKVGGRASQLKKEGFTFDMGPTFYWMPDVFDRFFSDFDKKTSDFYQLNKLNPAYQVYFGKQDSISIGDNLEKIISTFEQIESGSGEELRSFISKAKKNYEIAIEDLVFKPGENLFEIITVETAKRLGLFLTSIQRQVRSKIKDPRLQNILEFPVLFLGAKASNTPAFYNFMNYADFNLGTWHPTGGMYNVAAGMETLAKNLGVTIHTDSPVSEIKVEGNSVQSVIANGIEYKADILVSGADYHHTETLLPDGIKQYSENYWKKKTFAPSALMFYVGFDKKIENVSHHTLFFDTPFETHAVDIYDTPNWPKKPLFYASFPSITDTTVAPEGKEAGIFLIPIAPGLKNDTEQIRENYFNEIIKRLEENTNQELKQFVSFKTSYSVSNFIEDYNSYKGNAYGLANTLLQTHILRPKIKHKKLDNMYFTGQLTVPGPGVPPSLISGKIVSELITKYHENSV